MRRTGASNTRALGLLAGFFGMLGLVALPGASRAAEPRVDVYEVLKDGDPIGTEEVRFEPNGADLKVKVNLTTRVNLLFLKFRHDHAREETWRDGRLVEVSSKTDDDGTPHTLTMTRQGEGFTVTGNGKTAQMPGDVLPLTLWTPEIVKRSTLLSVMDGEIYKVKVETLPPEKLTVRGQTVEAKHYRISGDVQRELWYGPDGTLLKTRFERRGYDIVYRLR